jgi:hypothetical protein
MVIDMVGYRENVGHRLVSEEEAADLEGHLIASMENIPAEALVRLQTSG